MESFLDEFCLMSEGNVTNNNFKITTRFDFLAPPNPDNIGFVPLAERNFKGNDKPNFR